MFPLLKINFITHCKSVICFGILSDQIIDLLKAFAIPDLPINVQATSGICGNERNSYQIHPAPAYAILENAMITIPSINVFPNGFPPDFSIITTFRPNKKVGFVPLFTMYSSEGDKVFSLIIGSNILLHYRDTDERPKTLYNFDVNVDDNQWHHMAISVSGNYVTLILDCKQPIRKSLDRNGASQIATDGIIISGLPLAKTDGQFVGVLQTLLIAANPNEAYYLCTKYANKCDNEKKSYSDDPSFEGKILNHDESNAIIQKGNFSEVSLNKKQSRTSKKVINKKEAIVDPAADDDEDYLGPFSGEIDSNRSRSEADIYEYLDYGSEVDPDEIYPPANENANEGKYAYFNC